MCRIPGVGRSPAATSVAGRTGKHPIAAGDPDSHQVGKDVFLSTAPRPGRSNGGHGAAPDDPWAAWETADALRGRTLRDRDPHTQAARAGAEACCRRPVRHPTPVVEVADDPWVPWEMVIEMASPAGQPFSRNRAGRFDPAHTGADQDHLDHRDDRPARPPRDRDLAIQDAVDAARMDHCPAIPGAVDAARMVHCPATPGAVDAPRMVRCPATPVVVDAARTDRCPATPGAVDGSRADRFPLLTPAFARAETVRRSAGDRPFRLWGEGNARRDVVLSRNRPLPGENVDARVALPACGGRDGVLVTWTSLSSLTNEADRNHHCCG
jgi:hypothetical protein